MQVLPLYLSRQAYVRAKVTSFLLDDPTIPADVKESSAKTASDYYRLAYDYTAAKNGRLIVMSGLSGSGKSTTAKAIARAQNAIHLRSDAVRKHLANIPIEQTGTADIYSPEMTQRTYDRLLNLGLLLASQGHTVILDGKYDRLAMRTPVLATGIPVTIVHCDAPIAVLTARVAARTGDVRLNQFDRFSYSMGIKIRLKHRLNHSGHRTISHGVFLKIVWGFPRSIFKIPEIRPQNCNIIKDSSLIFQSN